MAAVLRNYAFMGRLSSEEGHDCRETHLTSAEDDLGTSHELELYVDSNNLTVKGELLRQPEWRDAEAQWTLCYIFETYASHNKVGARTTCIGPEASLDFADLARDIVEAQEDGTEIQFALTCVLLEPAPPLECDHFSTHNVVFLFPDANTDQRCLWARKATLVKAFPYWKMLFEAGYSESVQKLPGLSNWKSLLATDIAGIVGAPAAQKRRASKSKSRSTSSEAGDIAYIVIREEPLHAYRAVLTWLTTKQIAFGSQRRTPKNADALSPTSPQVIYALAHKLEITDLQRLALQEFAHRLDTKNCMARLLSRHAFLYPEIKEAAMKAVIENWEAVKGSGWNAHVQSAVKAGDWDIAQLAEVIDELLSKV